MNKGHTRLSKFISLVLRHDPSAAGITLDKHGWADVKELIQGINKHSKEKLSPELLKEIVRDSDKQRFSFNDDFTKIRANQGHSINVDVELEEAEPPEILYHGTTQPALDKIKKTGLTPQSRLYVHLSADKLTAHKVGSRHGSPVILQIAALQMYQDGYNFYISKNGVWLVKSVPAKYINTI